MTSSISTIPLASLLYLLVPVALVIWVQYKWSLNYKEGIYSVGRMLGQLLLIGYFLGFIFNAQSAWMIIFVLTVMVLASSWIALRTVQVQRNKLLQYVVISLLIGGGSVLLLVTQGVLKIDPWFSAKVMIPMAGMIFSNAMNSISLAAERFDEEFHRGESYLSARNIAFKTALIPMINSLFAVGLVSLPGMMTGQILSGVDPLIAARYQVVVMAMIFASGGLSSALYLIQIQKHYDKQ